MSSGSRRSVRLQPASYSTAVDVSLTAHTAFNAPTAYKCDVSYGEQSWSVSKRYADFQALATSLEAEWSGLPALPEKKKKGKEVEQLQVWCSTILSMYDWAVAPIVQTFFALEDVR